LFVRQRLSSEPDRYRGRRRVPTPPRSRYAVVVTSAFVGAGIVALGAATNLPDAKAVSPSVLQALENASVTKDGLAERGTDTERASRSEDRSADVSTLSTDVAQADVWGMPIDDDFTFTSPFGMRFGELHAGIDLAAPEGTLYKAVHGGVVKSAGYSGGYGYAVTVQHQDGTVTIYGHSRKLLVHRGQVVKVGDVLGEVGNTGYAFGTHLHLEIHLKGSRNPCDPVPVLLAHGIDIKLGVETVYSNLAAG
jgi:murein DD-endopeptidase MepM/ murein hydrolase activator NlpD